MLFWKGGRIVRQSQLTRWPVLDVVFVGVAILFFVVSIGYVAALRPADEVR